MVAEGDDTTRAQRNWQSAASYQSLYQFNRAELDLAFARRYAERLAPLNIPVEERLLRLSPPVRLLTRRGGDAVSAKWGLRFRGAGFRFKRDRFLDR